MAEESQIARGEVFRNLHTGQDTFIMPNAWDAGSAKMLMSAGFACLGTTSAGIAFAEGYPDHQRIERAHMIERATRIAHAVTVPASIDLEAGYGDDPETVSETIRLAIGAGFVGANLEDFSGSLLDRSLAVERVAAARAAADATGVPFTLTARTDPFLAGHPDAFAEAVTRSNLFREAGTDCFFVPGASRLEEITGLAREIDGPLNVVMGLSGNAVALEDLAAAGVRRVSIGGSLSRATFALIRSAAIEMRELGSFTFADAQVEHQTLCDFFETGSLRHS